MDAIRSTHRSTQTVISTQLIRFARARRDPAGPRRDAGPSVNFIAEMMQGVFLPAQQVAHTEATTASNIATKSERNREEGNISSQAMRAASLPVTGGPHQKLWDGHPVLNFCGSLRNSIISEFLLAPRGDVLKSDTILLVFKRLARTSRTRACPQDCI